MLKITVRSYAKRSPGCGRKSTECSPKNVKKLGIKLEKRMDLAFEKYPELWEYRMSHVERLEENLAELDEKFGPAVLKCFTRGNTI